MTKDENAYATALDIFGSDRQSPEEHDILMSLHARSIHGPAGSIHQGSLNWLATLAAVAARGPRCDACGGWTFRQVPWTGKSHALLCTSCENQTIALISDEARQW